MKTRALSGWMLIFLVTTLPVFASVCDLKCDSAHGSISVTGISASALSADDRSGSATSESCPLHAPEKPDSVPGQPASIPCDGHRPGGGAILVASSSYSTSLICSHSPASYVFPLTPRVKAEAQAMQRFETAPGRMPRSSPLSSILRL